MFSVGEVAAKIFALYIGHLGRRELVVQPATQRTNGSRVAGFYFWEEGIARRRSIRGL